ncbi:AsmA family protein [bacterium]|nr:AsmA family protein [bacterium]
MFKWIKRIIILFILLAIAAFFALGKGVNTLVKSGIEKGGTHLTDVPVTLKEASVALMSGGGSLSGLRIANPEGFKSDAAITVENATLALEPGTLMSKKMVIRELKLEQPAITYERTLSGSNLDKIMEAIQKKIPETQEDSDEVRFQIDDFQILQAHVKLGLTALGGNGIEFTLPDISLKDLGTEGPGLTGAELTKEIMKTVLASVVDKATGQGLGGFSEALKGALNADPTQTEETIDKAKNLFNNVKSLLPPSTSGSNKE